MFTVLSSLYHLLSKGTIKQTLPVCGIYLLVAPRAVRGVPELPYTKAMKDRLTELSFPLNDGWYTGCGGGGWGPKGGRGNRNHLESLEHSLHQFWNLCIERGRFLPKAQKQGGLATKRNSTREMGWKHSTVSDPLVPLCSMGVTPVSINHKADTEWLP